MQPFFYETETHIYTLVCNGEIYNHKELETNINYDNNSKSDCEVILPYFAHYNNNFKKSVLIIISIILIISSSVNLKTNNFEKTVI